MRENNVDKLGIAIARQTGNVGIGTDSPSEKLQVSGSGNESVEIKVSAGTTAGNTGSISLSRTDGSGNIIQGAAFLSGGVPIGGIAGGVVGSSNTSAPAFAIQTPNSTNGHIVFKPKGTEKVRIQADGNVGIGVTSFTPGIKLEVAGNLAADGLSLFTGTTRYLGVSAYNTAPFINTGATGGRVTFGAPTSYTTNVTVMGEMKSNTIVLNSGTNNGFIRSLGNLVLTTDTGLAVVPAITITNGSGNITINGTATATNFILSSDKTLKNNIKEIDGKHVKINWKNFELKSEPGIKRAGVIAQELEKTNPEFVRTDNEGLKSVAYIDLLITKIAELEARLEKAGI